MSPDFSSETKLMTSMTVSFAVKLAIVLVLVIVAAKLGHRIKNFLEKRRGPKQ